MIIDLIKARIKQAMLAKNDAERNILRLVLGEAQLAESRQGSIIDEQVVKIIKKLIENNKESIGFLGRVDRDVVLKQDIRLGADKNFVVQEKFWPKGIKGKITAWDEITLEDGENLVFCHTQEEISNRLQSSDMSLFEVVPHPEKDARAAFLQKENEILASLVPQEMTAEEIEVFLKDVDVKTGKEGQAIGAAMKALKIAKKAVDGNIVANVVRKLRSV